MGSDAPADVPTGALRRLGISETSSSERWIPLTGGVSSDIWRVELPDRTVCVKRARPVLAVAAVWHAPVERSESEVAWLEVVGDIDPNCVPSILGHLPDDPLFVMELLDPSEHPVWKGELAAGLVDVGFARRVGALLGTIHARTAGSSESCAIRELLERADVVSLHVPLDDSTRHLIDADAIASMKRGAVLVNTARGGLVDEAALIAALRSGHLRAAGLDTFEQEPTPPDNPLLRLANVVVTPHVAWLTTATLERSITVAVENCRRLGTGEPLLHRVA